MSSPAALLRSRTLDLSSGAYLERADTRESETEHFLQGLFSRVPRPNIGRARRVARFVANVNAAEAVIQTRDSAGLIAELRRASAAARAEGFTDAVLVNAFAAVREASRRVLGMRHHDVQLIGGWTLLNGMIAEMQTGEGKTLVATLAACAAAATGAATHVVTVNDYLAERDAETNRPLYEALGLTVGTVLQDMTPQQRRQMYCRDVVYVSNKEVVFDYLKDRIALGSTLESQLLLRRLYQSGSAAMPIMRGLHYAIVDEADSVLVDEARTPLIISETEPDELSTAPYVTALEVAAELRDPEHFVLTRSRQLWLTPSGQSAVRTLTQGRGELWRSALWRDELIRKALSAIHSFQRDQHYIVVDGKVQIVDEFTGRVMPDRSWEQGLHQMIEAKEGAEITGQRKTLSRLTYQRFFRRYLMLAGMTGTAAEVAPELRRIYDLDVVKIPTNKPSRRRRQADTCWRTHDERWAAVAERAIELSKAGRSVLIGTRSVEASERLGALLAARGVAHTVLNARQDKEEAAAVAQAGKAGRITVATNMAGRGTDIRPDPEVLERGGLHVILTEFHESSRIDRQLFGRSGRQGEPGTVEAMVSLEDELFHRFAPAQRSLCARAM